MHFLYGLLHIALLFYKFGYPIDAVNGIKVNKIKECTKYYLYKEKVKFSAIRFDVIEIYKIKEQYVVNHIKNAF